ncbi:MAG: group 1 truncated hemoglobin [Myxococcales bacterium]|nr:group 1 truncated hemoglobin [Myxococcales bacterium]
MTPFEQLGGEDALREIIDDFVDHCFDDAMIGYFFQRASRARIKRFEYEHAAALLGAPLEYRGRGIPEAHASHRILGGQFDRRLQILREAFERHAVPASIRDRWLAHAEALRSQITSDPAGQCID